MSALPTEDEMQAAIRRIAITSDGLLLYRKLQLVLTQVPPQSEAGPLLVNHGRRTLARELKDLMDQELVKTEPTRARSGRHDPDAPVVERQPQPVHREPARGAERRVQPYPIAGDD